MPTARQTEAQIPGLESRAIPSPTSATSAHARSYHGLPRNPRVNSQTHECGCSWMWRNSPVSFHHQGTCSFLAPAASRGRREQPDPPLRPCPNLVEFLDQAPPPARMLASGTCSGASHALPARPTAAPVRGPGGVQSSLAALKTPTASLFRCRSLCQQSGAQSYSCAWAQPLRGTGSRAGLPPWRTRRDRRERLTHQSRLVGGRF